jgi:hypothetical protein
MDVEVATQRDVEGTNRGGDERRSRERPRRRWRRAGGWVLGGLVAIVALGSLGLRITPRPLPAPEVEPGSVDTVPIPDGLPGPVERFYRTLYGDEVPVVDTAVISGRGTMRVNGITFPARFRFSHVAGQDYRHYIEVTVFGRPLISVNEWFIDGTARLELPFGIMKGPAVDQGANLALWAEAGWMPSVWLTDPRVHWGSIDATSAALHVPFGELTEAFTVHFDPATGMLTRMESLRHKGEEETKTRWITEVVEWGTLDGAPAAMVTTVTWADEDGPWTTLRTEEVLLNADLSDYLGASGPWGRPAGGAAAGPAPPHPGGGGVGGAGEGGGVVGAAGGGGGGGVVVLGGVGGGAAPPPQHLDQRRLAQFGDLADGGDAALAQLFGGHRPDAPEALHGQGTQEVQFAAERHDQQSVRLGDPAGDLGQELRARDTDRDGQPHPLEHLAAQPAGDLHRRPRHPAQAADLEEGLVNGQPLDHRRGVAEHPEDRFAGLRVGGHARGDDDGVRAQPQRLRPAHRRANPAGLGLVAGRQHHPAADDHRPPAQPRVVTLLHRRVERVKVRVQDRPLTGHPVTGHPASLARTYDNGQVRTACTASGVFLRARMRRSWFLLATGLPPCPRR